MVCQHTRHPAISIGVGKLEAGDIFGRLDARGSDSRIIRRVFRNSNGRAKTGGQHPGAEPGHEIGDEIVVYQAQVLFETSCLVSQHAGRVGVVIGRFIQAAKREITRSVDQDRHFVRRERPVGD